MAAERYAKLLPFWIKGSVKAPAKSEYSRYAMYTEPVAASKKYGPVGMLDESSSRTVNLIPSGEAADARAEASGIKTTGASVVSYIALQGG